MFILLGIFGKSQNCTALHSATGLCQRVEKHENKQELKHLNVICKKSHSRICFWLIHHHLIFLLVRYSLEYHFISWIILISLSEH